MQPSSRHFPENARRALADDRLRAMLDKSASGFRLRRRMAADRLPEFEALRDRGRDIKDHTLAHLDLYLERFEAQVRAAGGTVHWCADAAGARDAILAICRAAGAKTVTKGKSMIAEEIAINDHLEAHGLVPVETDLGEYIVQLRKEPPSHIIAPAFHVSKEQVAESFRAAHTALDPARPLDEPSALLAEARAMLRRRFHEADVGITGANLLIAETGQTVIVTNEGNGDLTQTLPPVHIVLASIEKVVPTPEDAATVLRLLARSATGQEFSAYTTFSAGPRRAADPDGPRAFHVVLLDNGRSALMDTEFREVLRCIRCGACMNHCPVYGAVGGHAYGWVYPGPLGAVLDPALIGLAEAKHLPNASTFCGRCEEVCPMRIPLPAMMRHWRRREAEQGLQPAVTRRGLALWAWFARRPALYHAAARLAARLLRRLARRSGTLAMLPGAGGWTRHRDLPAPEGRTFRELWAERRTGDGP
ncbi:lactate utilization protein B [Azospirillum halopraeferens]|uniref:lactate utilization protein B n=1 Tax=Azospirillum halopraeferens TaxID=34010 RepID=UPI0004179AE9|nr:lactate utilization protein B [Azospirillum halopraeferens]